MVEHSWVRAQWRGLFVSAVALLLLFELTPLDHAISAHYYLSEVRGFPWQHNDVLERYLHTGLKNLMTLLGVLSVVVGAYLTYVRKMLSKRRFWVGALAVVLIPLAVVALKWLTQRACPWSLDIFGGSVPHISLLSQFIGGGTPERGQCFPAGHSAGGYFWLGWGVALLDKHPAWGRFFLMLGVLAGMGMGWVRIMQGAHFLSHVLWAGWVAWAVSVLLLQMIGEKTGVSHKSEAGSAGVSGNPVF